MKRHFRLRKPLFFPLNYRDVSDPRSPRSEITGPSRKIQTSEIGVRFRRYALSGSHQRQRSLPPAQNFLHCQAHAVFPQTTLAANCTSNRVHLFAILMHDETVNSLERTSAA